MKYRGKIKLIQVEENYTEYLFQKDSRVTKNKNKPYISVIVTVGEKEYAIPLTSYNPKHDLMKNKIDFH